MLQTQIHWNKNTGWDQPGSLTWQADLVLVFADHDYFHDPACYQELKSLFPQAYIIGCSSAGNIMGVTLSDGDMIASAIKFEHGYVRMITSDMSDTDDIQQLSITLMEKLQQIDLKHVFVLADGLTINGSELADGLNQAGVSITGGLAGDGTRFSQTWVMADAPARQKRIALIGLYGDLKVKTGCFAGWQEFGAERLITKSTGSVVYEIDHKPALDLYQLYLGAQAEELPASGLRFPISVRATEKSTPVIRTLLAINEETNSLIFAGDVPQGYLCKLMKTNIDSLIANAGLAADAVASALNTDGLCLVVSCVGRRLVLDQLIEEELDIVQQKLGAQVKIAGFYSYGELAPFSEMLQCQLHNQTMTLTTIYE